MKLKDILKDLTCAESVMIRELSPEDELLNEWPVPHPIADGLADIPKWVLEESVIFTEAHECSGRICLRIDTLCDMEMEDHEIEFTTTFKIQMPEGMVLADDDAACRNLENQLKCPDSFYIYDNGEEA